MPVAEMEEQTSPPSPTEFVECGDGAFAEPHTSAATSTTWASQEKQIPGPSVLVIPQVDDVVMPGEEVVVELLYYGSEPEEEDNDEEFSAPLPGISRVQKALLNFADEEEQHDLEEGEATHLHTPQHSPTTHPLTPEETQIEPSGLFNFLWSSFPDPPIAPVMRREKFAVKKAGPVVSNSDPYSTFVAIWDRDIMQKIAAETNKFAEQLVEQKYQNNNLFPNSRINTWVPTNVNELYVYFAIILAMGNVIKGNIGKYWCTSHKRHDITSTPNFAVHMSQKRFELLSKCLHFVDNLDVNPCLNRAEAKLKKIAPIIAHLNKKFQKMYVLQQDLSLDESLLQWKGWLDINQFISNKAAKVGIKTYDLCESQTGYLWRFMVHAHKATDSRADSLDPLQKTIPTIVLKMVEGLENKGHTLWMDNYYQSPALARHLKSIGFDCAGTVRTNRQYVPSCLKNLSKNNIKPGQLTGYTSGDVDLLAWLDNNNKVSMLSTYHGNAVARENGKTKPSLVFDYNIMMGGVDKKDQMLASYPIERCRTKIWYKKLFRRLLNISVLNTYILVKKSSTGPITHRDFREILIESLLVKHSAGLRKKKKFSYDPVLFSTHYIDYYPSASKSRSRLRRNCVQCKKRVGSYCAGCRKTVCVTPPACFITLHSSANLRASQ